MNNKPGPGSGNTFAGIFLILFGLCLTLGGGGCSLMLVTGEGTVFAPGQHSYKPFLYVALAFLGVGLGLIGLGVKLMRSGLKR